MKKRFFVLFLMLALALSLSSCIWIVIHEEKLDLSHPEEMVVKIELYDIDELEHGIDVFGHTGEEYAEYTISNLDNLLDPIRTLEGDEARAFFNRAKNINFSHTQVIVLAPSDPHHGFYDYVAKITYDNGDYDVISNEKQYYYVNGEETYSIKSYGGEWNEFIKEYLN